MFTEVKGFFPLVHPDVEAGHEFMLKAISANNWENRLMRNKSMDIIYMENPILARYIDTGGEYYSRHYSPEMSKCFNVSNVLGYLIFRTAAMRNNSVLPRLEFEDIKRGIQAVGQLPDPSHRRVEQIVKKLLEMGFSEKRAVDSAYGDTDEGIQIGSLGKEGARKALVYMAKKEPAFNGFLHWISEPLVDNKISLEDSTDVLDFDSLGTGERRGTLSLLEIYTMFALRILHPRNHIVR